MKKKSETKTNSGRLYSIKQHIKSNNLSGSLDFVEIAVNNFQKKYEMNKTIFKKLLALFNTFIMRRVTQNAVQLLAYIRSYLESTISFCRKTNRFYPIISPDYGQKTPSALLVEIVTHADSIQQKIEQIAIELTHFSINLFSKYVNARAKKINPLCFVDMANFPDVNDIAEDIHTVDDKMVQMKSLFCELYSLFLKDYPSISIGQDIDFTSQLSTSLATMRSKLEKCEALFLHKAHLIIPLLSYFKKQNNEELNRLIINIFNQSHNQQAPTEAPPNEENEEDAAEESTDQYDIDLMNENEDDNEEDYEEDSEELSF